MRKLKVYGTDDAVYRVFINNKLEESCTANLIYEFETDTTLHDSYNIRIEVIEGTVTLEKCLVDYPAIINGKKGKVTFDQPIDNPMYTWNGQELIQRPFPIKIQAKDTVEFEQLMFNGPTLFDITVKEGTEIGSSLYIGNLITKEFIPEMTNIVPVYAYEPQDHNIWSNQSLQKLVDKVSQRLLT